MRFWRHLKSVRQPSYTEAADDPAFWGPEDVAALSIFLGGSTGKKLGDLLNNRSITLALAAVHDRNADKYDNGKASGVKDAVDFIKALMGPVEQEELTGET